MWNFFPEKKKQFIDCEMDSMSLTPLLEFGVIQDEADDILLPDQHGTGIVSHRVLMEIPRVSK